MQTLYVRDKKGQPYHIAQAWPGGGVAHVAVCGCSPSGARWQRSSNVSFGNACQACVRRLPDALPGAVPPSVTIVQG